MPAETEHQTVYQRHRDQQIENILNSAEKLFNEKGIESVYGWIMGTLSVGFYIGNIYGSVKSARLYNNNQNLQYREKVIDHYINHY